MTTPNNLDSSYKDDEVYMRTNIKKAVWVLLTLFAVMVVVGVYFESYLVKFSTWFVANTNPLGVYSFVLFNDAIVSPIPPDIILVLVTKGVGYKESLNISIWFGIASSLGGCLGWVIGRYVLKPHWLGESFKAYVESNHGRINRYGKLMVALGALTPVPYSMTCWAAGFLKMDFKDFVWVASLRVLRFVLYFKIILASEKISAWLTQIF